VTVHRSSSATVVLAVLATIGGLAWGNAAVAASRWGAGYFPNVLLTTQDGTVVRFYDDLLKGKTVAINVMFTDCKEVCPLQTARLVQLKRLLGDRVGRDIFFYSISIDPERDLPGVLRAYAEKFGAGGPGWLFLTGKPEDVSLVTKKLGLVRSTDGSERDAHSTIFLVGHEATGQWMRASTLDNPRFLAPRMGAFLGWRDTGPAKSYAEARPLVLSGARYLFDNRCGVCHSVGDGDKVGPDLRDVTLRRDRAWLTRDIQAPDQVLATGDPIATALFHKYKQVRMPNLRLASDEVAALLSYLEERSNALREEPRKGAAHVH